MDSMSEKKWFIYINDQNEGPFSVSELQEKLKNGQLTSESFVWAEGMEDWEQITHVPNLSALLIKEAPEPDSTLTLSPISAEESLGNDELLQPVEVSVKEKKSENLTIKKSSKTSEMAPALEQSGIFEIPVVKDKKVKDHLSEGPPMLPKEPAPSRFGMKKIRIFIYLLILVGGGYYFYGNSFDSVKKVIPFSISPSVQDAFKKIKGLIPTETIEKIPYFKKLTEMFSSTSSIEDISPEDNEKIKNTIDAPLSAGSRAVVVFSDHSKKQSANELTKGLKFYVATNLKDNGALSVGFTGEEGTLLNYLNFEKSVTIRPKSGIGSYQFSQEIDFPRGYFWITVEDQLKKNLFSQKIFLGGREDEYYKLGLQKFHDKIRSKAKEELIEIEQFYQNFSSQFKDLSQKFSETIKGKISSSKQIKWKKFYSGWNQFQGKLMDPLSKVNNDSDHSTYFLDDYLKLKQVAKDLEDLSVSQNEYVFNSKSRNNLATKIKNYYTKMRNYLQAWENRIKILRTSLEKGIDLPPRK